MYRYQDVDLTVSNDVDGGFKISGGVQTSWRGVMYLPLQIGKTCQGTWGRL